MANQEMNQLVSELARETVTEIAPQELPLFRATSQEFAKDPERVLTAQSEKDALLGFGAGEAVILLTPYVLAVTSSVVSFLAAEVSKSAIKQSAGWIGEAVKGLFKKYRPEVKPEHKVPPLSAQQLAQVQEVAMKEARRLRLSDKNVKLLANAIVGSLAVASA